MKQITELSSEQIRELIELWVTGRNAERDRNILRRRLIDGLTYDSLAAEFEMSRNGIQGVVYKRIGQIFSHT